MADTVQNLKTGKENLPRELLYDLAIPLLSTYFEEYKNINSDICNS